MDTVVFDLGGVLVDWNPRYLLRKVMPGREAEMETVLAEVFNHAWNLERDRGDSWPEAIAELEAAYPQWAGIIRTYDERWPETIGGDIAGSVELLHELKSEGTPLYALSNWSAEKFPLAEQRFDWLELFDGIVVSGRIGLAKPDAGIFRYLLDTYALEPERLFFVDDHEPNIAGARAVGIHAHHFRDPATLRSALEEEGLLDGLAAPV